MRAIATSTSTPEHDVLLGKRHHGACLSALFPGIRAQHIAYFHADLELGETAVHHGIVMHVNFITRLGFEKGVAALRKDFGDTSDLRGLMSFHIGAHAAGIVFELPAHGVKSVPHGDTYILVRVMFGRLALHRDGVPGDFQPYPDMKQIALPMA